MPLTILIGAQWGDEGKGRIVDLLSARADVVARFNGGDNAGHTVTVGAQTFKLHLLPSGMIHPHTQAVVGNGVVVNPTTLLAEMDMLREHGLTVTPQRLKLSHAAHLITPAHRALDAAQEAARGAGSIGTTGRGIGPAYTDKAARSGLRLEEIENQRVFGERVVQHVQRVNQQLTELYGAPALDVEQVAVEFLAATLPLAEYVADVSLLLDTVLRRGGSVLAEGAQGTLLDLDHGTYPYVTSSSPTAPGALVGLGVGPGQVDRVIGVVKAFQTRVGAGPFPTELEGDLARALRGTGANPWDEFGTTTGRARRVGWLDVVLLRYSARVNGFNELVLTKLDILSGLSELKICTAYRAAGQVYEDLPRGVADLSPFAPVYEDRPTWSEPLGDARHWEDLPAAAQTYIRRIEALCGVPVRFISVGPEREQVVRL